MLIGWGGFNIIALKQMEPLIDKGALMTVCKNWQTTHDVGKQ